MYGSCIIIPQDQHIKISMTKQIPISFNVSLLDIQTNTNSIIGYMLHGVGMFDLQGVTYPLVPKRSIKMLRNLTRKYQSYTV